MVDKYKISTPLSMYLQLIRRVLKCRSCTILILNSSQSDRLLPFFLTSSLSSLPSSLFLFTLFRSRTVEISLTVLTNQGRLNLRHLFITESKGEKFEFFQTGLVGFKHKGKLSFFISKIHVSSNRSENISSRDCNCSTVSCDNELNILFYKGSNRNKKMGRLKDEILVLR